MTLDLYGHLLNDQFNEVADAMDAARAAGVASRRPTGDVRKALHTSGDPGLFAGAMGRLSCPRRGTPRQPLP
jgi:hypothetical protein